MKKQDVNGKRTYGILQALIPRGVLHIVTMGAVLLLLHAALASASPVDIRSRSAVVMDAVTGRVLYAKNPDLQLMPASTTKLMTGLITVETSELSRVVTISRNASRAAPTTIGLKPGDRVTIETLLYAALLRSANDAAVALAEAVAGSEEEFVNLMNVKAMALGADSTRFINPNGLPGEGQHITTYDLAKIMRHAIKYPVLKDILSTRVAEISTEGGKTLFLKNTNKLLWSDEEILGGKTGYTRQARHCFVSAGERDNATLVVALLGAPSRDLLWKETEELLAFGSRVLSNSEEAVVYFSKADYDAAKLTKVSYTKQAKAGPRTKSLKKKTTAAKNKTALVKSKGKKNTGKKTLGKNKKTGKKTQLGKKGQNGNRG